jgi:hypothetical protein
MPDEVRKLPIEAVRLIREKDEDFSTIYSNNAGVNVTYFDIKITFGELSRFDPEKQAAVITDIVEVYMSPEHARALHGVLGKNLENYEREFGPIRKPPTPDAVGLEQTEAPQHTAEQ